MTVPDYQSLARHSPSFQTMEAELQNKILNARGADMDEYVRLFTQEKTMLNEADEKKQQSNEQIINNFHNKAQKKALQDMRVKEADERKEAANEADDLLKQI